MAIQSKNPATEAVIKTYEELGDASLEAKLRAAATAYASWKETTFAERGKLMYALGTYLRTHKEELATLASLEMGKVKTHGIAEIEKCAGVCDFYADNAERYLAKEPLDSGGSEGYAQFDPLGIVLAVMPWNFPFWQVLRFAAPALMAGNVGLLKHASNVPGCAEAIERAFTESGFPEGIFQNLLISSSRVEKIIRDPRVMAVTLTGSEKAGSDVARIAGSEIKKTVLELGGSDPFIVLADADIREAAGIAARARMQHNAGQSCIAAKRFIVHESVAAAFETALAAEFKNLVVGDPMDPTTTMGPLATEQGLLDIKRQVDESTAKGARVVFGGERIGTAGYFYAPTILSSVTKGMPAYDEETFGPIAPIITFASDSEAIDIANDTPYGLGAVLCTTSMETAKKMIARLETGSVFVNGQERSDARAPFGGIKRSGYGRELSHYGIKEFVNVKTVWIK